MECGDQVARGIVRRLLMDRGPKVERVPLDSAVGIKAAKNILLQVYQEAAAFRVTVASVYRTGTSALCPTATKQIPMSLMLEHPFYRYLTANVSEVYIPPERLVLDWRCL